MPKNQPSKTEQSVSKNQPEPARSDHQEQGLVSIYKEMNSQQLRGAVKQQSTQRKIIKEFVQDQLVEGIDFGVIEGDTKKGGKFKSKPVLMKPGQEKIFSLFGLTNECHRDDESLEMLSNVTNLVAYKCIVYRNNQKIAEGRGAAQVGEKSRDVNSTIKMAEKRARMDACLSLGFSEFFTQDLDDMDKPPRNSGSNNRKRSGPSRPPKTAKKKDLIGQAFAIVKERAGFEINREQAVQVINTVYGGEDFSALNSFDDWQALFSDLRKLQSSDFTEMLIQEEAGSDEAIEGEIVEEPEPAVESDKVPEFKEEEE